jgi:L,D-peptidoglycan transpeptidase YkuD (ErfK/YbiS/YcfS/YnhG family)
MPSKFKLIKITKKMGWCDDPKSKNYNQLINLPFQYRYENDQIASYSLELKMLTDQQIHQLLYIADPLS